MEDFKTKDFQFWMERLDEDDPSPFMVALRNPNEPNSEWVYASLTEAEAKNLYEFLREYFK